MDVQSPTVLASGRPNFLRDVEEGDQNDRIYDLLGIEDREKPFEIHQFCSFQDDGPEFSQTLS
jgi:hypothetical protein